jgi:hypothetical protein
MPYIAPTQREHLDFDIEWLVKTIESAQEDLSLDITAKAGLLNYIFTRILQDAYPEDNYNSFNERIGILECCKLELYRSRVAPYEEQKKFENGDV